MIAVANNERPSHDPFAGLPEITPELIRAYKDQIHTFETDFADLRRKYPDVAHDLITGIEGVDPRYLDLKRAFAQGALYMCGLFRSAAQIEQLRKMFETETVNDGDDDEDRQP